MARESREVWTKRVERWRESDLSAVEFASELGVNVNTLRSWAYKLRSESNGKSSSGRSASAAKPRFVEVTSRLLEEDRDLEVVVGSGRFVVRIPVGFDATTLRALVPVLEELA